MSHGVGPKGDELKRSFALLKHSALTVLPRHEDTDIHNTSPSCDLDDLMESTVAACEMIREIMSGFLDHLAKQESYEAFCWRRDRMNLWIDQLELDKSKADHKETPAGIAPRMDSKNAQSADRGASADVQAECGNIGMAAHDREAPQNRHPPAPVSEVKDSGSTDGKHSKDMGLNDAQVAGITRVMDSLNIGSGIDVGSGAAEEATPVDDNDADASSSTESEVQEAQVPVSYAIHVRHPLPEEELEKIVLDLRDEYDGIKVRWKYILKHYDMRRRFRVTLRLLRLCIRILNRKSELMSDAFFGAVGAIEKDEKAAQAANTGDVVYTHE